VQSRIGAGLLKVWHGIILYMRFQRRTLSSTACSSSDSTRFGVIHELSYPQSLVSLHAPHYIPSVSSHHTCTRGAIRSSSHSYESSSSSDSPTDLPSSVRTYRALIGRPRCLNQSKDVYPRLVLCSAKTPFECFPICPPLLNSPLDLTHLVSSAL